MTEGPRFNFDPGGLEIISMGGDQAVGAMIRKARIFGDLTVEEAELLARRAWAYRADPGTEILCEGEVGGRLFLLIDGVVEIFKNDEQGQQRRITALGPGATIGEMSLVDDLPFSATARVDKSATLILLRKDEFDRLAEERPDLHLRILRRISTQMSLRLRKTTNTLSAYLGKVADLTESLHRSLSNNKNKTAILASMSHDLRTPLNSIIGFSELFEEESRDRGEGSSDIKRIQVAGRHMLSLINNILDFAKMEAGKMHFVPTRFQLQPMLSELETIIHPMALENHNQLHFDDCPGELFTDRTKLMQILINLLGNASKFTKEGSIYLRVNNASDTDQISFEVQDTGIGIPRDQVKRLFQVFEQADNVTGKGYGGSGLGLHLSQMFAHKLGGAISVESHEGEGSTFTLTLPLMMEKIA